MPHRLEPRHWVPAASQQHVAAVAATTSATDATDRSQRLNELIAANAQIHDRDCVNLNPATNTMSPAANAALAAGLGT
jgi:glycine hydroxymethyltransferase